MRQIGHKCFIGLMVMCLSWSLVWCPVANAQAGIAAGRLSVAISEITIAKAARWGFAANDPRVTATRAGISGGLTVLAVGAGLVSWPALLVAAGIATVVAGAIALSSDGKYTWNFGADGKVTTGGTTAGGYPVSGIASGVAITGGGPIGPTSGKVYTQSLGVYDGSKVVYHEIAGSSPELVAAMWGGVWLGTGAQVTGCGPSRTGSGAEISVCNFRKANGDSDYVWLSVQMGYSVSSSSGSYDGRPPAADTPVIPVVFAKPDEAVVAIPASVASQLLSNTALAAAVNAAWKSATPASQTGGIPWSASDPVTPSDVANWASANPSSVPSVANFVSAGTVQVGGQSVVPIGNSYSTGGGASATLPSTGGSTNTGTTPDPTPAAPTTPADSTNPQVNLGPIPNIAAPVLEDAPTAEKILDPGFSLMPDLKNFAVPAHAGACPTAGFALYGKSYVMDAHCTLLEQNRSVIGALMVLIFTLVATYTVLRA